MKVLDIYPDGCWSFRGVNEEAILKLRAAVLIADEADRELALSYIPEGDAYRFIGDPAKFEFAPGFYDKVNLMFAPGVSNRVKLRQCIRRWSKNAVQFGTDGEENPPAGTEERPTITRYLAKLLPTWAS